MKRKPTLIISRALFYTLLTVVMLHFTSESSQSAVAENRKTAAKADMVHNEDKQIIDLIQQGDWKGAKTIAEAWLKDDPKSPIALFIQDATGHVTKTLKPPYRTTTDYPYSDKASVAQLDVWVKDMLSTDPINTNFLMLNGILQVLGRNDHGKALEFFEKVLEHDPNNVIALGLAGAGYGVKNRLDDATRVSEKAIVLDPDSAQAYGNIAMVHMVRGNRVKAEEYLKKAVSCSNAGPMDWFNLGTIYVLQGRTQEGKEAFLKAIELCPNLYPPHWNLASVYYSLGMKKDCIRELKKVIQLAPDSVEGQKAKRNLQALER